MDKQDAMEQLKEFAEKVQLGTLSIEASNPYIPKGYLMDWEHTVVDAVKALEQKNEREAADNQVIVDMLRTFVQYFKMGFLQVSRGSKLDACNIAFDEKLRIVDNLDYTLQLYLRAAANKLERR